MSRLLAGLSGALLLPVSLAAQVSVNTEPMLRTYCIGCHNEASKAGGLMLDKVDTNRVRTDAEVWEKILKRLRSRTMPPPFRTARPDGPTYQASIAEIETHLDKLAVPPKAIDRVSDRELASRMATLLWGNPPDAVLLESARRGDLKSHAGIEKQVQRMIADPQSRKFAADFIEKWLRLDDIPKIHIDPEKFADYRGNITTDMKREASMFIESQFQEDHAATELFTANYSFVNSQLAKIYGVSGVDGDRFVRVTFNDDHRAGILGLAGFLAMTSFNGRTSATLRGKWLYAVFFGAPPPAPPSNLPQAFNFKSRRQLDEAYSQGTCRSCHFISQLGGPLENFDDIGRWRTTDLGEPVDASGMLPDGTVVNGPAGLRSSLMKYRDTFIMTLTERLMAYALGRGTSGQPVYWQEMSAVRTAVRAAAERNYSWSSIICGVVESSPFQMKKVLP